MAILFKKSEKPFYLLANIIPACQPDGLILGHQ